MGGKRRSVVEGGARYGAYGAGAYGAGVYGAGAYGAGAFGAGAYGAGAYGAAFPATVAAAPLGYGAGHGFPGPGSGPP